ncbi:MAG: TIGR03013 family XrtA/PEP-CTERM system glycosyltransferase [Pseudomonadota bacterium]
MQIRLFNQNIRLPLLLLAAVEGAVLSLAVVVAQSPPLTALGIADNGAPRVWQASIVAVVLLVAFLALGLYQFNQRFNYREVLARLIVAFAGGWLVLAATYFAFPEISLSRSAGLASVVLGFIGVFAIRYAFLRTVDQNIFRRRCLVLGGGENAINVAMLRRASDRRGFRVIGYVCASESKPRINEVQTDARVIEHDRPLADIAAAFDVDEIVVALDDRRGSLPVKELVGARLSGVTVTDLLGFFERETGKVRLDFLRPSWIIFSDGFAMGGVRGLSKRLLDLAIAIPALLVVSPVMLATAIAILAEGTGRSVFYRQIRVGERGQDFGVLKFRSMREDAEADGKPQWATQDDKRVTAVGRFIRKVRIDELPQLLNVIRGEMSVVGPRPERPAFVEQLSADIPFYAERHCIKPGITGWAQLRYPYGASQQDAIEKLQYDLYYVKHQSLLFDLAIMLQTAEVLLFGKGAR